MASCMSASHLLYMCYMASATMSMRTRRVCSKSNVDAWRRGHSVRQVWRKSRQRSRQHQRDWNQYCCRYCGQKKKKKRRRPPHFPHTHTPTTHTHTHTHRARILPANNVMYSGIVVANRQHHAHGRHLFAHTAIAGTGIIGDYHSPSNPTTRPN